MNIGKISLFKIMNCGRMWINALNFKDSQVSFKYCISVSII